MTRAIKIGTSQHGNNPMSDIQNRMIRLEGNVQQVQVEIAKINTRLDTELPHLATKADLKELEGKVNTGFQNLAGKLNTGLHDLEGKLNAGLHDLEGKLNAGLQDLEGKLNAGLQEADGKLNTVEARLGAEIVKSRNTIVVWLIGFVIATGLMNWYGPSLPHLHSGATALTQTKMT